MDLSASALILGWTCPMFYRGVSPRSLAGFLNLANRRTCLSHQRSATPIRRRPR
jgi:hypothetical protein